MLRIRAGRVHPVTAPPIEDGAVLVDADGKIAAIGPHRDVPPSPRTETLAYADAILVPGLVNCHTHLELTHLAGRNSEPDFAAWIRRIRELKDATPLEAFYEAAVAGVKDCWTRGVTCVAETGSTGGAMRALHDLGGRGLVYQEVFGPDPGKVRASMQELDGAVSQLRRLATSQLRVGVSPHAPYTCSTDVYEWALSLGVPVGTHLAESEAENEWLVSGGGAMAPFAQIFVEPTGETGVRMLARHGLLVPELLCAHCVQLDSDEVDLLAAHDVPVAHCPRSNALLGCGIAPIAHLRDASARVGLGTDSPASTPSFDVFEELRAAIYMARARERRPDALSAAEALELATLGSARALGLDAELGSLAPGKRADLAVVSLSGSPYLPWEDPAAAVVYGGSPDRVAATLVDGETRYEKGTFEWHEVHSTSASARSRMLRSPAPAGDGSRTR